MVDESDDLGDGVEHLQTAAREVIKAGRSLLDAAEGLIDDPTALQGLVGTLGALAQGAIRSLGLDGVATGGDGDGDGGGTGTGTGKVEKIPLS